MNKITSLVPALAIGSALLLAACGGGGGSSSSVATTAPPAAAPADNGATPAAGQGGGSNLQDPAVQQCLADKGVTLPSLPPGGRRGQGTGQAGGSPSSDTSATTAPPNGRGQGGPFAQMDPATRQALQDCGVTFGRGGQGGGGGFGGAVNDPAVQQCLADKGVTLPTRGAESPESPRPSIDDATRQAIQDCRAQAGSTTTAAG